MQLMMKEININYRPFVKNMHFRCPLTVVTSQILLKIGMKVGNQFRHTFVSCNQEQSFEDEVLSIDYEPIRDLKSTNNIALKSQASELAFSMSKSSYDQQQSVACHYFPPMSQYNGVPRKEKTKLLSSTVNNLNIEASQVQINLF